MSKINAADPLATVVMAAKAKENQNIIGQKRNDDQRHSLEKELVGNGWRDRRNDFKAFLNNKLANADLFNGNENNIPEEEMDKLIDTCLEYAEVDQPVGKDTLRNSLHRVLIWEPELGLFSYIAPEIEGSSGRIKEAVDKCFFPGKSNLKDKGDHAKYRKYIRHLFTSEPSEESRKLILQFAYLLNMTSKEAQTYLTKWSFGENIRWNSPWELAAAYEIERRPAREEDRAEDFLQSIKNRIDINGEKPDDPENKKYLAFIHEKEHLEYSAWVSSYNEHCQRNQKEAFLGHWAWLILALRKKRAWNGVIPKFSYKKICNVLPGLYSRLTEYAQKYIPRSGSIPSVTAQNMTEEDQTLRQEIINVMKNRHLRLTAAAYVYARRNVPAEGWRVSLVQLNYVLPRKELGFDELPVSVQEIEGKSSISRSDIIHLGIELALTVDGINQLLAIGGFYELYARDFFEYALIRTLSELKKTRDTDGRRFGVKNNAVARNGKDIKKAREALKEKFISCLDENYEQLTEENGNNLREGEPNWIKEGIRWN